MGNPRSNHDTNAGHFLHPAKPHPVSSLGQSRCGGGYDAARGDGGLADLGVVAVRATNGPLVEYRLVWRLRKRPIFRLGKDGFFHHAGAARGVLVESDSLGQIMHHYPEDYLRWRVGDPV